MLQGVIGHQGHSGLVVGHSVKKGRKQVKWAQVVCVLPDFYFDVWMQNEGQNFFFLLRNCDWRRGKEEEKSPVGGMISLDCGV